MQTRKGPRGRPRSQFKESSAGTVQSLDRALTVLTAIAAAERVTLSDLSRDVGIPAATLHRILTTLQTHGYAAFDGERQQWRIGIEAYRTGTSFLRRSSVLETGQPFMHRLMQDTGETANIGLRAGPDVVYVAQVETTNPIRAFFAPGTRSSMHASGTGKAILAAMDASALERVLAAMPMTALTPNTHVDRHSLERDLAGIRARGWAHDTEEHHAGMSCIGAAIHDFAAAPCAGISVSGPSARFGRDRIEKLGELVARAARDITDLTGGTLPDAHPS